MALLADINRFALRMEELASGGLRLLLRRSAIGIALNAEGNAKQYATIRRSPNPKSRYGPVRSGRLRNSIAGSVRDTPNGVQVRLSAGGRIEGKDVKYAGVQEGPPGGGTHTIVRARRGALPLPVHESLFTAKGVQRYPSPLNVPNLEMSKDSKGLPVLRNKLTGEVFYVLRHQVSIPAKRFLRDGLRDAVAMVPDEYRNVIRTVIRGQ